MLRGRAIYVVTILRLLVIPVAAFAILHLLRVDPIIAAVSAILVGPPAGSNAVIFAEKFDGDSILATRIVVMTTALSILSIPLLAILVS
jgi:predicted permease